MPSQPCFHCSLPSANAFTTTIHHKPYYFCCAGCQAITQAIVGGGLENFYAYREAQNLSREQPFKTPNVDDYEAYDQDSVQKQFVLFDERNKTASAAINIEGITCAACVWLIEKHLEKTAAIYRVSVNASSHQGLITFDPSRLSVSELFRVLASIGFSASPSIGRTLQTAWTERQRTALLRLGVAGLGMMQAGMASVALHAGDIQGISAEWQNVLRWLSLFLTTPVLFYSGFPFLSAAYRSLKFKHLTMDVPVSIALLLAYFASVYATLNATGEVYFDAVGMFIFFLLLGRYFEQRVRFKNFLSTNGLLQLIPLTALKVDSAGNKLHVPVSSLQLKDIIWVASGETIPCDGWIVEGKTSVDESLITGESRPVPKGKAAFVVAGSMNVESGISISVEALGSDTQLAEIERLANEAAASKPVQVVYADRVAGYFVACVLIVAIAVGYFWLQRNPSEALWVVLSVLVVTCPCALSLATPTALTSALHGLRERGVLVTSSQDLEHLSLTTDIIFDKTGTLTKGQISLGRCLLLSEQTVNSVVLICAALQRVSSHPIARAFSNFQSDLSVEAASNLVGSGVEGVIDGNHYKLGRPEFTCPQMPMDYPDDGLWVLLAKNDEPLAWLELHDEIRSSAAEAVKALKAQGIIIHLVSGDRPAAVQALSNTLAIDHTQFNQQPHQKLHYLKALQAKGRKVLMVGDGINDVPVLSAADTSLAMGHSSQLAMRRAGAVLLNNDLTAILFALNTSLKVRLIIKQNLAWALAYNLTALPLAAAGLIPPWLAAIGMSSSSLVVVFNALRLR